MSPIKVDCGSHSKPANSAKRLPCCGAHFIVRLIHNNFNLNDCTIE